MLYSLPMIHARYNTFHSFKCENAKDYHLDSIPRTTCGLTNTRTHIHVHTSLPKAMPSKAIRHRKTTTSPRRRFIHMEV